MRTLAFLRPVVIERRANSNAMRQGNDIELRPLVPYEFSDTGAEFFKKTYPNDVLDLTPRPITLAVRQALAALAQQRSVR